MAYGQDTSDGVLGPFNGKAVGTGKYRRWGKTLWEKASPEPYINHDSAIYLLYFVLLFLYLSLSASWDFDSISVIS